MTEKAQKLLKEIARVRKDLGELKDQSGEQRWQIEQSEIWKIHRETLEMINALNERLNRTMDELKNEVLKNVYDGENKKPISGVQVKTFKTIEITDEKQAKLWAATNAPSTIKLNEPAFGKAVSALELEFVKKGEENRVQVSSDLSEYLNE